jgi:hypothetical protein
MMLAVQGHEGGNEGLEPLFVVAATGTMNQILPDLGQYGKTP